MNAYDEIYLEKARTTLGSMLDFAVNMLGYSIRDFWDMFLVSQVSKRFQFGDSSVIVGKSGVELCLLIVGRQAEDISYVVREDKSPEYWAGWALGYYQWNTGRSFRRIDQAVPLENIVEMYFPYHEMDIRQFCDRMDELIKSAHMETNLKRIRSSLGLTQSKLAEQTGIPVRTIQQYEQGQKNINAARSAYLIALSKALYCSPEELLEQNR